MKTYPSKVSGGLLFVAALSFVIPASLRADAPTTAPSTQPTAAENKTCPVSGDPVDPAITATYDGKTYAFCCKDCIKAFNKDPAKYAKNAK
jgi:YHS domain-containing protein